MSTCPFCSEEISEDLSLYGGHCPNCLIEIPGEEAVTDPGVVSQDVATPTDSSMGRMIASIVVVCAIGLGGWWFSQGDTDDSVNRNHGFRPAVPLSAHQDQQYEAEEEKAQAPSEARKPSRKRRKARSAKANQPASGAAAPAQTAQSTESTGSGLGSAPVDMFSAIGAAPRSRGGPQGIVLEDSAQIEAMVGRVLTRGKREIEGCFEPVRRANPSATGKWYVAFTVSKEGRPIQIGVEPLGTPNSAIESCIQSSVSSWRFQRVADQVYASDTYRMGG